MAVWRNGIASDYDILYQEIAGSTPVSVIFSILNGCTSGFVPFVKDQSASCSYSADVKISTSLQHVSKDFSITIYSKCELNFLFFSFKKKLYVELEEPSKSHPGDVCIAQSRSQNQGSNYYNSQQIVLSIAKTQIQD